jgi:hypothetical protein
MLFFESFMDEGAQSRMHDAILQCFPTQGDGVTEELWLQRLQGLAQGKLVSFVGVGLGSLVTVILDVMTTRVDGCHPKWELVTQTDFIKRVKARMGYFLQYEVGVEIDGARTKILYGSDAAAEYHKDFVVEVAKSPKGVIAFSRLVALLKYEWLFTESQRKDLTKWKSDAVGQAARATSAKDEGHPDLATSKKRVTKSKTETSSMVDALFV